MEEKREILPNSREYIEGLKPDYIPTTCPRCGGNVSNFGIGPEGKQDFSLVRVICWKCGKRQDYRQDAENKCYVEVEPQK
jgi:RNase P subunit RPR2